MVMVTAKLSKQKLLLIAALLVAVVVVLCLCLHGSGNSSETPDTAQEPVAVDVKTNEGRVAFLASFGWEVAEEPVQTQDPCLLTAEIGNTLMPFGSNSAFNLAMMSLESSSEKQASILLAAIT